MRSHGKLKNYLNRHYIMLMVIIPIAYCYVIWEGFQRVKVVCIHLHNKIQVYSQMVSKLWFHEGKVREGPFIFHVAQDHDRANFGHLKPFI
jgi:hypothetical protein